MKNKIPRSPLSTCLSGSAKETELRIRNIFQWKKNRPPVIALILAALIVISCGSWVGFSAVATEKPEPSPMETDGLTGVEESTDVEQTMDENLSALEQAGPVSSKIEVMFLPWETKLWQEPMEYLTGEQKDLLANLPVSELPREPVELWPPASRRELWRDTLIPLAADAGADVTLYGVVAADSLTEGTVNPQAMSTDGIVLRSGNQAIYYPLSWAGNAHRCGNPWLSAQDYDGDGEMEAAICFLVGTGTGINVSNLYFFDLDTMTYLVPDCSAFGEIEVEYDPNAHTATMTSAADSLTVDVPEHLEPLGKGECGSIVYFYEEAGQIFCQTGLDFRTTTGYLAYATAPVIWQEGGYGLGEITFSITASERA